MDAHGPLDRRRERPAARAADARLSELLLHHVDLRFDAGQGTDKVADLTGRGNDLVKVALPGAGDSALTWSADHHPDQPGHASLFFDGDKDGGGPHGAYLRTVDDAPLNSATFDTGYTVEAFFRLPADWDGGRNGWSGILSRWGESGQAGRTGGDPQEPVVTLSLSGGAELQWCVYPLGLNTSVTNWGHYLPLDAWWHVAVVNDGRHTTMYVDGCPVVRNPSTVNHGLATVNLPWLLGGYEYGGKADQIMKGWIGDTRITARALSVSEFMNA